MCLLPTRCSTHATDLIEQVPVFQRQGGPAVIHVLWRNKIDTRRDETQSFCERTPGVIDESLKEWHLGTPHELTALLDYSDGTEVDKDHC